MNKMNGTKSSSTSDELFTCYKSDDYYSSNHSLEEIQTFSAHSLHNSCETIFESFL